ncbi:TonB-dependent receptor domain-containing protein [Phenylobacterium terrae]|uniref:TonB-dependent receptor domain-containing protein n=1 Tax=Phenylobacterium terrae TaxID=2665495 RepID=A0ABW4N709_9CAUL
MKRPAAPHRHRLACSLAALAIAAGLAGPALAQTHALDLPAGDLDSALSALAAQTGQQLLYRSELVAGRRSPPVAGRLTAEEALARLLAGTGLAATRVGPDTLVLKAEPRPVTAQAKRPTAYAAAPAPAAEAAPPAAGQDAPGPVRASAPPADEPHLLEEVRVTGTHIRGAGQGPSPLVVVDRVDLERSGHATAAAALQVLPQVFGGESTEATVGTRADRQGTNASFGTGVNLRGLGSDATLVMVDGRRTAGSGLKGDFTDLSSLPTVAVERIELLLDGASALYGSDAVGGVVNVILRRDFEGLELRARSGAGQGGSAAEGLVGLVAGHGWAGGSLLFAYEAYRREALKASDRAFTRSADLRPYGGTDWRQTFAFPGNILRTDPATGASVPYWAIPPGQAGVGLRPQDFVAGAPNLEDPQLGTDILPEQRRQSAFVAVKQSLGESLELSGDVRYSVRRAAAAFGASTTILTVRPANPFFVSPNGAASNQIQYSFSGELPNPVTRRTAESLSASLGGRLRLPGDWQADGYVAFAEEIGEGGNSGVINTALLNEALGNVADRPETGFSTARDGFFNPYTGLGANPPGVLAAIGSGFTHSRTRSRVETANLQADGALFQLPGGPARLAVGAQARREGFVRVGSSYTSTVAPSHQRPVDAERTVEALFAELRAPLLGAEQALGALEVSAAARWERYSDFGESLAPKIGFTWSPLGGLKLRATYGESFRAPALQELFDAPTNNPILFSVGDHRILALALQGGNPTLQPETATTWTAGFDLEPAPLPGLRLSATWFRTRFKDRIDRPVSQNVAGALTDPRFTPFVRLIAPATNAADREIIARLLADPATTTSQGVFPPEAYGAVVEIRNVNTGALEVEGIDAQATLARDVADGRLSLSLNASWILDYRQQLTPTATWQALAGTATFPADFRARLAADFTRGPWSLGLAANHTSGFEDGRGRDIDALTTLDAYGRITGATGTLWEGLTLALNVRNLLDADPPFYDNPLGFAFDPSAHDAVGRFVSLQLTRRW